MKKYLLVVVFSAFTVYCFGLEIVNDSVNSYEIGNLQAVSVIDSVTITDNSTFIDGKFQNLSSEDEIFITCNFPKDYCEKSKLDLYDFSKEIENNFLETNSKNDLYKNVFMKQKGNLDFSFMEIPDKNLTSLNDNFFDKNRRNIYSSMWAFASLNYLYCDLVAFMDKDLHAQYHTGTVDGMKITPEFLTGAALMMQISIANVFLPQVIKNDRTLRWVQIASGITMTLIQSATLFAGKPTPYYAAFSALEIGATTFITINALKWKTK